MRSDYRLGVLGTGAVVMLCWLAGCADPGSGVYAARESGRYGWIDRNGRWVVRPRFEEVGVVDGRHMIASEDGRWGVVGHKGQWVAEPAYEEIEKYAGDLVAVMSNARWGILDARTGRLVQPLCFEKLDRLDGLFTAKRDGLYGFLDAHGAEAIPFRYQGADAFNEGLCAVSQDGKTWGYIDATGQWVVRPQYDNASIVYCGHAPVRDPHRGALLIDRTGTVIKTPRLDSCNIALGCRSWVKLKGESNRRVMAMDGTMLTPKSWNIYDYHFFLYVGSRLEANGQLHFLVDYWGNQIGDPYHSGDMLRVQALDAHSAIASVGVWSQEARAMRYGTMDRSGKWLVRPIYLEPVAWGDPFLGPARTAQDSSQERYRYFHPSGETAFVVKADEARPFERGMAIVSENGRWRYVDTEGRVVWREK